MKQEDVVSFNRYLQISDNAKGGRGVVFSSIPFLFYFLPLVMAIYYAVPFRWKNTVLVIFSLIFYALGEPVYILIMLTCIGVNFIAALLVERQWLNCRKLWMILAVSASLGLLGFYKYSDFLIAQINAVTGADIPSLALSLPIGISFFTFQALSYSVDVYRGRVKAEHSLIDFTAYVSMFPQLIAGPIVRYTTVINELHERKINFDGFSKGIMRFLRGLFKKVLIADTIGVMWANISSDISSLSVASAWLGVIGFTLQLFFDFSAYSDMAIGMGHMLGFYFDENFNYPLTAVSITDFWRRWHISLSSWFRDYVYIPLGGNRGGKWRHIRNLLIVWSLTGLWHGASWNFILWGMYYGVLLIMEKYVWGKLWERLPRAVRHILTLMLVVVGFEFFVFDNFGIMTEYLGIMFGLSGHSLFDSFFIWQTVNFWPVLLAACLLATPLVAYLRNKLDSTDGRMTKIANVTVSAGYIVCFILCVAAIVNHSYSPFLYFRF